MMHGRNNGKKLMAVRIVKHSFDIIKLTSDSNPVQILVDAIINGGPREDATRIGSAGVVRRQAVDVSPMRRVNQALYLLTTGAREAAFRNIKTIAECLADELINAAKGSSNRCDARCCLQLLCAPRLHARVQDSTAFEYGSVCWWPRACSCRLRVAPALPNCSCVQLRDQEEG